MKKIILIVIFLLTTIAGIRPASAYTTETPTTIAGLHWKISNVSNPSYLVNCPQMTDLYLDISGAWNSSFHQGAIGRVSCNTPQGLFSAAVSVGPV